MTPILQVEDLAVDFRQDGRDLPAVRGVSFAVNPGETVALVGESGSGKSVTALSTVQLLAQNAARRGKVFFDGRDISDFDEKQLQEMRGNDISFIFQEPMTSLNALHTIERQLAESLLLHQGLKGAAAQAKVLELMESVGIRDARERMSAYPHQLSGGQRQRVMIAMALANQPKLLIADEPTTALDVTIEAQILDLLAELKQARNMSMLFITHDLGVVRRIADRVCVMKDGEIVEQGTTAQIFENPQHDYTKMLLAADTVGEAPELPPQGDPILETQNLRVWFPIQRGFLKRTVGYVKAVNAASLRIGPGQTLGVVGESGSGKTTLALAILRLIRSQNPILFEGQRIDGLNRRQMLPLRADMQVVFQDPFGSLSPRMSIFEIISEGLAIHDVPGRDDPRAAVAQILGEVGIDPEAMDRYPHEFSGGQRQRVAIARAMILRPKFVVLDEPTSALDRTVQLQIVELLRDLQRRYKLAYLFISHDLKVVRALSHHVMVMQNGDVVEEGDVRQIFDAPQDAYTKSLLAAALV